MGRSWREYAVILAAVASMWGTSATAQEQPVLWLEEMTSPEIQAAMAHGHTWLILPTAGIEQNGQHLPLNKHHRVVAVTAAMLAGKLGNALIAPIVDYVPEGDIASREGHMAFAGTLSLREQTFEHVLEDSVRSFHAHGFSPILLIGDSGGNQQGQAKVAEELREEGIAVYHVSDYYANAKQEEWLVKQGFAKDSIGFHAGLRDTAEFMASAPDAVRMDRLQDYPKGSFGKLGAEGAAAQATPELGKQLLELKVALAVTQICREVEAAKTLPVCAKK